MRKLMKMVDGWKMSKLILAGLMLASVVLLAACGGSDDKQTKDNTDKTPSEQTSTPKVMTIDDFPETIAEFKGEKVTKAEFTKFLMLMRLFNPDFQTSEQQAGYFANQLNGYLMYKNSSENVAKKTPANDPFMQQLYTQTESGMNKQLGEGAFSMRMKEYGLNKQDVLNYFLSYNDNVEYVKSKITEKEFQDAYDSKLKTGEFEKYKATVSHILIMSAEGQPGSRSKPDALKKAQEVLAELRAGADFGELAKKYSDDPGSKNNGGIYADADVDTWVPEFRKAAIELPLNELSEPVETNYGYHIMKVLKREKTGVKKFEEVKGTLEQELWSQKYQVVFNEEVATQITNYALK